MKIDLNNKIVRFLVQEYVNKICHYSSKLELKYDIYKLVHTFFVMEMAQKLIDLTKPALPSKIKKHILDAAVLHDVGRCYEFKNGKKVNIDHGKVGADLIKKYFPKMEIEAQSTFFHNKLPSDKDPKTCYPVLDYVRDADMLANLKYQVEEPDIWLDHILDDSKKSFLSPIIDEEIFQSVQRGIPVRCNKIKTQNLLTMWLWELCWFYNLKTKAGIIYARKEKIFPRFKAIILKNIIPLTTKDKKKQAKLVQQIQECFPDSLLT